MEKVSTVLCLDVWYSVYHRQIIYFVFAQILGIQYKKKYILKEEMEKGKPQGMKKPIHLGADLDKRCKYLVCCYSMQIYSFFLFKELQHVI